MKIEGSVAIVTGAASGIGKSVCELLLERGAKIVLIDIDRKTGNDVTRKFEEIYGSENARFICCNVANKEQLKDAFCETISNLGHLDIVFNNAGVLDEENWSKTLDINLGAVVQGTLLGIEHMEQGVIINTSSTGGLHPASFCPVYCASKHGVIGFTRSIALSAFRKKGIRVNCVCPGSTDTAILSAIDELELTDAQKDIKKNLAKQSSSYDSFNRTGKGDNHSKNLWRKRKGIERSEQINKEQAMRQFAV